MVFALPCSQGIFAPDQIHLHHSLQTTKFAIFNPEQSSFSVYMIPEFNFFTGTRISFRVRTEMNSSQNDLYQNKMLFQYHVNKYREINGDGMNSFQNEGHSSIMWIAPKYYAVTFKQLIPEKGGNPDIQSFLVCVPLPSSSSESDKQVYILYAFNIIICIF